MSIFLLNYYNRYVINEPIRYILACETCRNLMKKTISRKNINSMRFSLAKSIIYWSEIYYVKFMLLYIILMLIRYVNAYHQSH